MRSRHARGSYRASSLTISKSFQWNSGFPLTAAGMTLASRELFQFGFDGLGEGQDVTIRVKAISRAVSPIAIFQTA